MNKFIQKLKQALQRTPIDSQRKPLKLVETRSNPDDSVMLHSRTDKFYIDPRISNER